MVFVFSLVSGAAIGILMECGPLRSPKMRIDAPWLECIC